MEKSILLLLFHLFTLSPLAFAKTEITNIQPLFLKLGFSSVVEFTETPEKVVIGDNQSFQVEKLNKSLVIRTLAPYASSNLFVYFKNLDTQIFTLTASEESNPTLLKKIEVLKIVPQISTPSASKPSARTKKFVEGAKLSKAGFNKSKDHLIVDYKISAGPNEMIKPKWDLIRLSCKDKNIDPYKIWSERKEIQKDSETKARLIFLRPNIGLSFEKCHLIIPLYGRSDILKLQLGIKK